MLRAYWTSTQIGQTLLKEQCYVQSKKTKKYLQWIIIGVALSLYLKLSPANPQSPAFLCAGKYTYWIRVFKVGAFQVKADGFTISVIIYWIQYWTWRW